MLVALCTIFTFIYLVLVLTVAFLIHMVKKAKAKADCADQINMERYEGFVADLMPKLSSAYYDTIARFEEYTKGPNTTVDFSFREPVKSQKQPGEKKFRKRLKKNLKKSKKRYNKKSNK